MSSTEEDKYFQKQDAERRAQLRKEMEAAAHDAHEKQQIADGLGTSKLDVVERIRALGFDGDTGRVFDLLPLIHVAWADGSVSRKERTTILVALADRGIAPGSEAFVLVETLLEERPSDEFLDETLGLLREVFESSDARVNDIVNLCVEVADSSGGFFGLTDAVSDDERSVIRHIADSLGGAAKAAFEKRLGK